MAHDRPKSNVGSFRRWCVAAAPAVVWLGAIGLAATLYHKRHRYDSTAGFAEDRSITIAHTEASLVHDVPIRLHQMVEPGEILIRMDDAPERLRLAALNLELQRLKNEVGPDESTTSQSSPSQPSDPLMMPLRIAADVREREILELTHRIDQKVHRAPTRGQIAALLVEAGDTVQPGSPMVVLAPIVTQRVVAFLPEKEIHSMGLGHGVQIRPTAPRSKGTPLIDGVVVSMSESVLEAPPRFRKSPMSPIWGREVIVLVNERAQLIPGEAVTLTWRHN